MAVVRLVLGTVVLTATAAAAEMPAYLREALNHFNPEVPKGWAYTLTTSRNGAERIVERYDPAQPPERQWTLQEHNGRAPDPDELKKYARAKAGGTPSAPQATFQRGDIAPESFELLREDEDRAEFRCAFREESAGPDKMLGHLSLRLTVAKRQPHVEKFALELLRPYSPVLGVKMHELLVQTTFAPPGADRPALPAVNTSHFVGRIFFIRVEENLETTFTRYAPSP